MRRNVSPQVWKTKILEEFKSITPELLEILSSAEYQSDFESLYQRLRLLDAIGIRPAQEELWVFTLLAADRGSNAFGQVINKEFDQLDSNKNTVLHYLALRGDGHTMEEIITSKKAYNLKVTNQYGHSLFHYAILGREVALREEVRKKGLLAREHTWRDRKCYDDQGELYLEKVQPWRDAVERILEQDPEAAHRTTTIKENALRFAIVAHDSSSVQFLVRDCRVDPEVKSIMLGMSALHYAAREGETKIVKFFIQDWGMNPLERSTGTLNNHSILGFAQKSANRECESFCQDAIKLAKAIEQASAATRESNRAPRPSAPSVADAPDLPAQMGPNPAGLFRLPPDNPTVDPAYFRSPNPRQ